MRSLPVQCTIHLQGWPCVSLRLSRSDSQHPGALKMQRKRKPRLALWKFASCDGCQLSLLDCEDELLTVAGELEIAHFLEASRSVVRGPYDLSLVEGSI